MTKKTFIYSGILAMLVVMPTNAQSQDVNDRQFREFTQTIIIDGKEVQGYGTAYRDSNDGAWRIISQAKPREVKSDRVIVKEHVSPKVVILKKKQYPRYGYNHHGYSRHNSFFDRHHYKKTRYHNRARFNHGFHGKRHHGYHKQSHYKAKHYGKKYH